MSNGREVEQNLKALDTQIAPDLLAEIERIAEPVKTTTWPSGRPENQDA
jgi:aryl-alcohol dehydrogenase-like predicted oxidoreductase